MKRIIFYTALNGHTYAKEWILSLSPAVSHPVWIRLERVKEGNFGDYKALGKDLYELRFRNGLRIYYTTHKQTIVILFKGGNKQGQRKDIAKARELLTEFKNTKEKLYD